MYKQCMADLFTYIIGKPVNFVIYKMTDFRFFEKFPYGTPRYDLNEVIDDKYSTIHFDGPHTSEIVLSEVEFFHTRTVFGSTFVFDDVSETDFFYSHHKVHDWLLQNGWEHIKTGQKKALYRKQ